MSRELLDGDQAEPPGPRDSPGDRASPRPDSRHDADVPTRIIRLRPPTSTTDLDRPVPTSTPPVLAPLLRAPNGRRAGITLATLAALGAVLGWVVAGATRQVRLPVETTRPWAVAVEVQPGGLPVTVDRSVDGGPLERLLLLGARVLVVNPSTGPVTVNAPTTRSGAVRQVWYPALPAVLRAGGRLEVYAELEVACRSPLPLDVPDLQVRGGGQPAPRPLPVLGWAAELVRACAAHDPGSTVVASVSRDTDDRRLRLELRTHGGRSIRVVSVSSGTVVLEGTALPHRIDGTASTIWLQPPAACPDRWRRAGLPVQLDLVSEGFGGNDLQHSRSRITVDVGAPLAAWLLETACPPR